MYNVSFLLLGALLH